MFDLIKNADRRQVLSVVAVVLGLSCVPTVLLVFSRTVGRMLPGMLIGIILYVVFLKKK